MKNFFVEAQMRYRLGNPSVSDYLCVREMKKKFMKSKDPIASAIGVIL